MTLALLHGLVLQEYILQWLFYQNSHIDLDEGKESIWVNTHKCFNIKSERNYLLVPQLML